MAGVLELLMGSAPQPELTTKAMYQHIARNPEMANLWLNSIFDQKAQPQPNNQLRSSQIMNESVAASDPFAMIALQRLMGMSVPDQLRLNESHGLARREQYRYR